MIISQKIPSPFTPDKKFFNFIYFHLCSMKFFDEHLKKH